MIDAPIALALASGMIAAFNPCGFAMLPAYLSYFLGLDGATTADEPPRASITRALLVGAVVSAGFVLVFGIAGGLASLFSVSLTKYAPWVTMVVGGLLAILGVALLAGWEPTFALPKLERGTKSRGLGSMFVFGISYAIASLGCTLPIFVTNIVSTFSRTNVISGLVVFLTYSLGMGLVLMVLTLALALARQGVVRRMRQTLPYVQRVAGALLIVAGLYVAAYSWFEIRTNQGHLTTNFLTDRTQGWSAQFATFVDNVGAVRLGLVLGVIVVSAVLVVLLRSGSAPKADRPTDQRRA